MKLNKIKNLKFKLVSKRKNMRVCLNKNQITSFWGNVLLLMLLFTMTLPAIGPIIAVIILGGYSIIQLFFIKEKDY